MNTNGNKRKLSFYLAMIFYLFLGIFIGFFLLFKLGFINFPRFFPNDEMPLSYDQVYANQMEEVIVDVDNFVQKTVEDWDSFLLEKIPNGRKSYKIFIEDLITAAESQEDLSELKESKAYKNLLEKSESILEDGIRVQSQLGSLTPPPELKSAHDELVICVQDNINQMQLIRYYLIYGVFEEPTFNCESYSTAMDLVVDFIKEHRPKIISF